MHDVDQVAKIAPETIELPDNEGIARAHRFKASVEAGTVVLLPVGANAEMVVNHIHGPVV
jgi:hypothetical protein